MTETPRANAQGLLSRPVTHQNQIKLRLSLSQGDGSDAAAASISDLLPAGWTTKQVGEWPYCER